MSSSFMVVVNHLRLKCHEKRLLGSVYFWYSLLKVMENINTFLAHYAIFLEWWAIQQIFI
jgi:hypothetical protein